MGFSVDNMAPHEVDCCGESTCVRTASQNQNVDKKCDRNTLTDSKSSSCSLQSSAESIGTKCTCETDINENLRSNFSSRTSTIKGSKLDAETVNCSCNAIQSCSLRNNMLQAGKSESNTGLQENHKRKNFIVQFFKRKSQGWNRNQLLILLILFFVEFFASAVVSIHAPFYPDIARQKGATASEYGLVFGILPATVFIISPFFGAKMSSLGPIRVFIGGVFTTGFGCIIFGLLNQIEGRVPFILTSLFVRVVEAIGDAAFETASFTIIAAAFPQSIGTSMALLEVSYGIGHIIGPGLGGWLYLLGGYSLPFAVIGSLLVSSSIATYFFFPDLSSKELNVESETAFESPDLPSIEVELSPPVVLGGFSIFRILKIPVIAIAAYSIVAAMTSVGVLSCNLEHHLEQFQLNKLQIGAVFILNGGVYAVTAPVWGWICDHTEDQKLITLAGAVFTILGFIFIGPFHIFLLTLLFGVGLAGILVPSFIQILKDAKANGYPDDVSTYGLVSSVWTSMSAAGHFIGPFFGGILDDWVGFRWSTVFVIAGMVVLIILLAGYYAALCRKTATSNNLTRNSRRTTIERP